MCDALHRPVERSSLPVVRIGRAIHHVIDALLGQQHAKRAGPLGTQRALVHWAARIALDVNRPAILRVDQLRAADSAERTDAGTDAVRLLETWPQCSGLRALRCSC